MLLINPNDVINLAFMPREEITPQVIRSIKIDVAQEGYIRPRFGQTMFQEMCAGLHHDFVIRYIQPALAQYVRSMVIEELAIQISDKGVIVYSAAQNNSTNKTDSTDTTQTQNSTMGSEENITDTKTQNDLSSTTSNEVQDKYEKGEKFVFELTNEDVKLTDLTIDTTVGKENTTTVQENRQATQQGSQTQQNTKQESGAMAQQQMGENYRVATPVERRVLCLRAMADAKVLLAKAVRYVEANIGEFQSYEPREFGSRIFF